MWLWASRMAQHDKLRGIPEAPIMEGENLWAPLEHSGLSAPTPIHSFTHVHKINRYNTNFLKRYMIVLGKRDWEERDKLENSSPLNISKPPMFTWWILKVIVLKVVIRFLNSWKCSCGRPARCQCCLVGLQPTGRPYNVWRILQWTETLHWMFSGLPSSRTIPTLLSSVCTHVLGASL